MKEYGLYIHIPFCKHKCYYCDFYSIVCLDSSLINSYIYAIEKEIIHFFEKFKIFYPLISTIYIGGGTPSILNVDQIEKLFLILLKYFNFKNLKEITIELNPESVTEEKLRYIKDLFFSLTSNVRVSLGVQTFNESILKSIGRIHTQRDIFNSIRLFKKIGFYNYNFDLIFGLPEQGIEDVKKDLEYISKFIPPHISYYALILEDNTTLKRLGYTTDEDLQAEIYKIIVDFLLKNEYNIYEISNFAKKGYECLHNLGYWRRNEYIGLGCSSSSFLGDIRVMNLSKVYEYVNFDFIYEIEKLNFEISMKEKIILSLRTDEGLFLEKDILDKYGSIIEKLIKEKKLILEGDRLKIPVEYKFISNQILVEFI